MEYTKDRSRLDEVVEAAGVQLVVDSKAVMFVLGTTMDFKVDDLREEFVFVNPNAKGTCGCGESFNV
jgi:iron-sulfur cluster assembly protein